MICHCDMDQGFGRHWQVIVIRITERSSHHGDQTDTGGRDKVVPRPFPWGVVSKLHTSNITQA